MAKSVTTYEKPTPHISLPDWYAKQWELQQSANTRRNDAFELRNAARQIRSETKIKTEWDTYMNNTRLADRVTELSRWRELTEKQLEKLNHEIQLLKDERSDTEKELENLNLPLQVTAECISMRDCRRGTELTYDEANDELKKELCVIEGVKQLLTNRTISYEAWKDHCRYSKLLADNEMSDTYNFREAMQVVRERARNDIRAQQDVSDFTLRKRIYQTQKARNELDWQKMKMQKEMDIMLKEIARLEDALLAKIDAIKCAETRLENRTYRPGFELCRDEGDLGLKDEVLQLRQTREDLINKINCAKATYNGLESLLIRIDKNLDDKQHSLMTDIMCLDMRARLKTGDRAPLPNETDRNIVLTRMEQEIPIES
ncbi:tektin-2 isoform X2 [Neodiprion fabricii]|uniref:tektin-2 isoform X2 n=1 Tax=Neodiprion fabricii TaxID=2872261 RepID=UPI001ED9151E|nr:tektin-2 isoform X2 [Neodiprion fabricii]